MRHYKSPAKLNLFLNIINKRDDGYHNIQSVFHLVDLFDYLSFNKRKDNKIVFNSNVSYLAKDNLVMKSLKILRELYQVKNFGMEINLIKNIPTGSGLGGGSSNAATTLMALSQIWNLTIPKKDLMCIGLKLGSDVPFFINGKNAWVEGRGEKIKKVTLKSKWYLLIYSKNPILTKDLYKTIKIKEKKSKITYNDFLQDKTHNIFESIVMKRYPTIARAKNWLSQFGKVRMSGTGGTIFTDFNHFENAEEAFRLMPKSYDGSVVRGIE